MKKQFFKPFVGMTPQLVNDSTISWSPTVTSLRHVLNFNKFTASEFARYSLANLRLIIFNERNFDAALKKANLSSLIQRREYMCVHLIKR